jgi:hypothetical protein
MWSFIICTHPQISLGRWYEWEWGGRVMWHAWERNVYKVLVGKSEGKRPLGRPRRRWNDGDRTDLGETGWVVWSGFSWLRIGAGGWLLWTRWWTFGSGAMELVVCEVQRTVLQTVSTSLQPIVQAWDEVSRQWFLWSTVNVWKSTIRVQKTRYFLSLL